MSSKNKSFSVILLAGGTGSRMQSPLPKQYMDLKGKPVVQHSLDVLASLSELVEVVIVAAPEYRAFFDLSSFIFPVTFAMPGARRQDSVYNGLQAIMQKSSLICVHDAARPFITKSMVERIIGVASEHGAATAAMPIKFTVKEANAEGQVIRTLERSTLWEVQTPQIMQLDLLQRGFDYAHQHNLTVTDDTSLIELLGAKVQLVEGSDRNIKLTTPEDFAIAQLW